MTKLFFLHLQTSSIQKNYNTPITDFNNWTRIVSISWGITNEFQDKGFGSLNNMKGYCLIRPQGFTIDKESHEFHGITNEIAINDGCDIQEILREISVHVEKQKVDYFVGHNIDFHLNVLRSEFLRHSFKDLDVKNTICLMKSSVDICKIPSKSSYKYPTLSELYNYLFNKEVDFRSNKNSNYYQYYLILECYKKLFNDNVFNNIGLIPDSKIELINVPFKKDNFPTQNKLEIVSTPNNKKNIIYNGIKLFSQIDDILNYENWGLYILTKNNNGIGKNEYTLIDYRGSIILKTFNRFIRLGFCPIEDVPLIFVNEIIFSNVTFYKGGLFIHENESKIFKNYALNKTYIIIEHDNNLRTLIDYESGRILHGYIKRDFIINEYSKYTIKFNNGNKESIVFLCNYESDKIVSTFPLNGRKLLEETINDELNYIHFLKDSKEGILDLQGNTIINNLFEKLKEVDFETAYTMFKFKKVDKYGFIDLKYQIIFEVDFDFNFEVFDNLIVITNLSVEKHTRGIISKKGELILPIIFDKIEYVEDANGDYFELKRNNRKGLYLILSNYFFDTVYDSIDNDHSNIILERDGFEGLYKRNGEVIFDCNYRFGGYYDHKEFQYIEIKDNDSLSLFNLKNFEYIENNYEKSRSIRRNDEFILIFQKGDFVKLKCFKRGIETEYKYENLEKHIDFKLNNRSFFIDFYSYNDERLIMFRDGHYGFVDINFKEVIPFNFSSATPFKNGMSDVVVNGISFKIDKFGNPFFN